MNVYLACMMFTLGTIVLVNNANITKSKRNQLLVFLNFVIWTAVMAFRGINVGTDTGGYQNLFLQTAQLPLKDFFHSFLFYRTPLYASYSKILSLISIHPQTIIIMNSLVYMTGICLVLYGNSDNAGMSFFFLLAFHNYFYAMNAARLSVAVMFSMWSYHFGIRGKKGKSILFLTAAVLTHTTAIVSVAVTVIANIKMNQKRAGMIFLAAAVWMPTLRFWSLVFIRFFPGYGGYANLNNITNSIYYENNAGGRRTWIALFLIVIFGVCLMWKHTKKMTLKNEETFWRLLSLAAIALVSMIVWRYVYVFARLEYYFSYYFMLLIPYCIERFFTYESRKIAYAGTMAVMFVPFYVKLSDYLPYTSVFH